MSDPKRLLLIDGHSLAFRAFHAVPVEAMQTTTGQAVNAVYGFTSMLLSILERHRPTHVAVAFDVARITFRNESYPEYKATRGETPPEFIGQIDLIKQVLDALGIAHQEKKNFEADDIVATLAARAREEGVNVLIASGDRDTFQLIDEHTVVLYPSRSMADPTLMTPEAVFSKYGVTPKQYPDLAALVGETSDNLPGVPGVGPKTAAKWLAEHGDLSTLLAHAEEIPGKVGQSLREHLEQVRLNRRLGQLVTDLDIGLTLAKTTLGRPDAAKLHEIFDLLEFNTLRARALAIAGADRKPVDDDGAKPEPHVLALVPGRLGAYLADRAGQILGVEVAGVLDKGRGEAWSLGIGDETGESVGIDLTSGDAADLEALAAFLADDAAPKAMADPKAARHMLAGSGFALAGVAFDTTLAAYLCYPDQRDYDIDSLSRRLGGRGLPQQDSQGALLEIPGEAEERVAIRAAAICGIVPRLEEELRAKECGRLLREVEMPLTPVLARMEEAGIAVDEGALARLERRFGEQVEAAKRAAGEAVDGRQVNLSSPKQLQEILFTILKMRPKRRTKTGFSTDAETIAELFAETNHPFLAHLLEHRDAIKMQQMVVGLAKSLADDGRIHATFHQSVAATGRLSSSNPNLQNIPARTEVGREIRAAFEAGKGYESLMTADYSQVEMRIMAHLSGDAALIGAFRSGEDLHRALAGMVFGIDPSDVTSDQRSRIKAMSYGLAYGLSAHGLARQLSTTQTEAKTLMDGYFERFGGIRDYLEGVVAKARQTGFTETMMGRRRYLPELSSDNRQVREMAERAALNAPIQGSAADIVKVAMLGVEGELAARGLASRMLLQVHDELVLEIAPGEQDEVEALVRAKMSGAARLAVPLDVSVGVGRTWDAAAH